MNRQRSFRRSSAWLLACLALGASQGCARPDAFRRTEGNAASGSGTPFHQSADHAVDDPARPAVPPDQNTTDNTLFHGNRHSTLPVGTLITVRLENSLAIEHLRAGDSFAASVAAPITADGATLIQSGTPVTGQIESAQPPVSRPGFAPEPALARLTLSTIAVDGKPVALQTASLFAKGTLQKTETTHQTMLADYRLLKGRPLTFRLISPLTLSGTMSVADREPPDSSR